MAFTMSEVLNSGAVENIDHSPDAVQGALAEVFDFEAPKMAAEAENARIEMMRRLHQKPLQIPLRLNAENVTYDRRLTIRHRHLVRTAADRAVRYGLSHISSLNPAVPDRPVSQPVDQHARRFKLWKDAMKGQYAARRDKPQKAPGKVIRMIPGANKSDTSNLEGNHLQ